MAGGVVLFSGTHHSQGHTRTPHTRHSSWQHWIPTFRTVFLRSFFFPPYAGRHSSHLFFAAFCNAILVRLTHVVHALVCVSSKRATKGTNQRPAPGEESSLASVDPEAQFTDDASDRPVQCPFPFFDFIRCCCCRCCLLLLYPPAHSGQRLCRSTSAGAERGHRLSASGAAILSPLKGKGRESILRRGRVRRLIFAAPISLAARLSCVELHCTALHCTAPPLPTLGPFSSPASTAASASPVQPCGRAGSTKQARKQSTNTKTPIPSPRPFPFPRPRPHSHPPHTNNLPTLLLPIPSSGKPTSSSRLFFLPPPQLPLRETKHPRAVFGLLLFRELLIQRQQRHCRVAAAQTYPAVSCFYYFTETETD
ncbi:hypothetical protein B0J18DRAFT_216655 [Chaetomium sp. MPI-SDFR-AT-0129]|nr:hypothetical protein B0J18DRAFT_216655 [Chaetomium sp. MPI-SDFR-AT-0129]